MSPFIGSATFLKIFPEIALVWDQNSPFLLLICILSWWNKIFIALKTWLKRFLSHAKISELLKKLLRTNILIPYSQGNFFDSWIYANIDPSKLFNLWMTHRKTLLLMYIYFRSKHILLWNYIHPTQIWMNPCEKSFQSCTTSQQTFGLTQTQGKICVTYA